MERHPVEFSISDPTCDSAYVHMVLVKLVEAACRKGSVRCTMDPQPEVQPVEAADAILESSRLSNQWKS